MWWYKDFASLAAEGEWDALRSRKSGFARLVCHGCVFRWAYGRGRIFCGDLVKAHRYEFFVCFSGECDCGRHSYVLCELFWSALEGSWCWHCVFWYLYSFPNAIDVGAVVGMGCSLGDGIVNRIWVALVNVNCSKG
jgi:hypothetical protein